MAGIRITQVLLAVVALTGCTTTAKYQTLQPASVDLSDTLGLAVFVNGDPSVAPVVEKSIAAELGEAVDLLTKSVQAALGAAPKNTASLKRAARALVADVVLVGDISFPATGGETTESTLTYQLIKARSGEPVAAKRTLTYDLSTMQQVSSREEAIQLTANHFAKELISQSKPDENESTVRLATPKTGLPSPLGKGNRLALRGDWEAAKETWEMALVADPLNDKLLYNLGVAHEATGDLEEAADMFRRAARQKDKIMYHAALDRALKTRLAQGPTGLKKKTKGQSGSRFATRNPFDQFRLTR